MLPKCGGRRRPSEHRHGEDRAGRRGDRCARDAFIESRTMTRSVTSPSRSDRDRHRPVQHRSRTDTANGRGCVRTDPQHVGPAPQERAPGRAASRASTAVMAAASLPELRRIRAPGCSRPHRRPWVSAATDPYSSWQWSVSAGSNYQFLGDKRSQVVPTSTTFPDHEGAITELVEAEAFTCFGPDTLPGHTAAYPPVPGVWRARHAAGVDDVAAARRPDGHTASWPWTSASCRAG